MTRNRHQLVKNKALELLHILEKTHPDATIALTFETPMQLLVATILSAQCTDIRVNKVTEKLFRKYRDAADFAAVDVVELQEEIRSAGFFRNKARNIVAAARQIVDKHGGEVPGTMEALTELPGVGRKTANVVLGNAFDVPGMAVDTHVKRVSNRLGWTDQSDPVKIEEQLCELFPRVKWAQASHVLIYHGRRFCKAPTPLCTSCPVQNDCPRIGVKRSR
ncbi:MAG: endonuclease III [Desulfuromonadales bacterium]